ncbi:MAG: isoprenylcysteine carboxylmethyltransferase family protein [Bacteroidia bacterium]|nr:isoprenylcysteine carboxylmethyltransferase family protein [Bacteroidia bacterium]
MKLKIPPAVQTLIFAALMWLVDQNMLMGSFSFIYQKTMATVLFVIGVFIAVIAVVQFISAKTTSDPMHPLKAAKLVTYGIYNYSRNPMYLAILVVLIAWMLALGNFFNLIIVGGFIWYITEFQIKPEEIALTKLFGNEYVDYCKNVRRWI